MVQDFSHQQYDSYFLHQGLIAQNGTSFSRLPSIEFSLLILGWSNLGFHETSGKRRCEVCDFKAKDMLTILVDWNLGSISQRIKSPSVFVFFDGTFRFDVFLSRPFLVFDSLGCFSEPSLGVWQRCVFF